MRYVTGSVPEPGCLALLRDALVELVLRLIQQIHQPKCYTGPLAQSVCVIVSAVDWERLEAIVADRNQRQKYVERARIVLASADRRPALRIAQGIGLSRPTVWRWRQRFAEAGVEGLLRDKTRKPGKAPIATDKAAQLVALTCTEPPHQATHWTGRAMAKAMGLSVGSVQRIWRAHKLQPHRLRTFKRSRDSRFEAKLADIVGLGACPRAGHRPDPWVDPPAHAVVLSPGESRGRSKRSTAPNPDCRWSPDAARP